MIKIVNDKRLKELGFRLLIPIHDELIGECPEENAKEVSERFTYLMNIAGGERFTIPIKCDAEVTYRWYGDSIKL
jgi:DNA polymerase I-like protein with 3'-5' exonuclease and polymerase domains